jgi:tetratricopeptide (TPR) repeat protein
MKKKVSILAFVLFSFFGSSVFAQTKSDAVEALTKAVETSKTDKAAAVKQLEEVISICDKVGDDAKDVKAKCTGIIAKWQNTSTIDLVSAKKYAEALASSEKAISLATTYNDTEALVSANTLMSKTYYAQGIDQYSAKNFDGALASFNKASDVAKANNLADLVEKSNGLISKVYLIKGSEFYSAKKFDDALASFDKATSADPKNAKAFYYTGLAFKGKNDFDNMVTSMEKAIEIGTVNDTTVAGTARRNLAGTFYEKAVNAYSAKKYADAITAVTTATKYNDKNGKSFLILAISSNELGQYDNAIASAKSGIAVESVPASLGDLYFQLGRAYEKKKDVSNACASYRKVTAGANAAAAQSIVKTVLKCK